MRTPLRSFFLCFLLIACIPLFCGCGQQTLTVNSGMFGTLTAEDVDRALLLETYKSDSTSGYHGPSFKLNERDGEIYLEEYSQDDSAMRCLTGTALYLVGCSEGEWEGWVLVSDIDNGYDENGNIKEGNSIFEVLLWGNCIALLRDSNDPCTVYIVMESFSSEHIGAVYRFTVDDYDPRADRQEGEKPWILEKISEFDSSPAAAAIDGDTLIIATEHNLLSVDLPSGKTAELFTAEYWVDLSINSIVKRNDSYFCGARMGILEYQTDNGEVLWYPYPNTDH